jgi:hypothetical protein
LAIRYEKKRREAFEREAARLGLVYERQSSERLPQLYSHVALFNQGFDRRALNVLRGTYRGIDVRLFEFQYKTQTHNGKQTQTQTHHVGVAIANLGRQLPKTTIVPETLGHKLWDAVGGDDIDFESDEFSRKFWVKSDDRRAAYDLIHARMMEYLMTPGWTRWGVTTPGVFLSHHGRIRPQDAQAILDRLAGFVELMPGHAASTTVRAGVPA